jgi:alpha-aminoadipate carrier protein LysW
MHTCPQCAADLVLTDVELGDIIQCPDCALELEVLGVDPLVLDVAPVEEEDWGE